MRSLLSLANTHPLFYSGSGNSFICLDNRSGRITHLPPELPSFCQHHLLDGAIFIEPSTLADWRYRIFNADGGEAAMCGNGLRCAKQYLEDLGERSAQIDFETRRGILRATTDSRGITVELPPLQVLQKGTLVEIEGHTWSIDLIDSGVPHALICHPHIAQFPLERLGPLLRWYPLWGAEGANLTLYQPLQPGAIAIRTYERGVERETLACGTGAVAAAYAALQGEGEIRVQTPSKEWLDVSLSKVENSHPLLRGDVSPLPLVIRQSQW